MTNDEILKELGTDSRLNRVRRVFANWSARIEQASNQREPLTPFEARRLEFNAALELIAVAEMEK